MTVKKVWLITGAGRGLGLHIAKAVAAAGHAVVATGRDNAKVAAAVGDHANVLTIKLDVTRPQDAQAAVEAAVGRFGRIDVLVNNAGNFFAGFFEELSPEQVRNQIEALLFGPMKCHPRRPAGDAQAALRPAAHHFVDRGHRWPSVLHGVCGREVRHRRVDGIARAGGRPLRYPHDAGRTRFLP
jgi:NAD(P)-dependent dehydrogenase (short-subunit alcohol dehydrogenase family)